MNDDFLELMSLISFTILLIRMKTCLLSLQLGGCLDNIFYISMVLLIGSTTVAETRFF